MTRIPAIAFYIRIKKLTFVYLLGMSISLIAITVYGRTNSEDLKNQSDQLRSSIIDNTKIALQNLTEAQEIQLNNLKSLVRNSDVPLLELTSTLENVSDSFPFASQSNSLSDDNPENIALILTHSLTHTGLKFVTVGYKNRNTQGDDFNSLNEEEINQFDKYEYTYFIVPEDISKLSIITFETLKCQRATDAVFSVINNYYSDLVSKINSTDFQKQPRKLDYYRKIISKFNPQPESLILCLK